VVVKGDETWLYFCVFVLRCSIFVLLNADEWFLMCLIWWLNKHLLNDLFDVEWELKPQSLNQSRIFYVVRYHYVLINCIVMSLCSVSLLCDEIYAFIQIAANVIDLDLNIFLSFYLQ